MRRPLALLLAAVMAVLDPALRVGPYAGRVFAAETPDAQTVVQFLEQHGVFKGPDDPLRSYVIDQRTGHVSSIGQVIYGYLKQDTHERLRDYTPTFDQLREQGRATPKMLDAAAQAQTELQTRFQNIIQLFKQDAPAGQQSPFLQNALLSASFDGAARAREAEFTQLETPDAFVLMDRNGVAARIAKNWACRNASWASSAEPTIFNRPGFEQFKAQHMAAGDWDQWQCGEQGGVTTFSRDVQKSQQTMNRAPAKPACAPNVPETGRYNVEMLQYSVCLQKGDVERSRRGYTIDLMVRLATMLGENVTEDMLLRDNGTLLARLKSKAEGKSVNRYDQYCGRVVSTYWDLATCKLDKRDKYIKQAEEAFQAYSRRVEGFKTREVITQAEVQGLQADEALVKKYLTLSFLEAQRNQAYSQLEGISMEVLKDPHDPTKYNVRAVTDSPDSKQLREALEKGPFDQRVKANYMRQATALAERVRRLLQVYDGLEDTLLKTDHAGPMGVIQGALMSTQRELGVVGLDSRLFTAVPMMTHLGNEETSGWSRQAYKGGAWLLSKITGGHAGEGYLQDRRNLDRYVPTLQRMAGMIAGGDFAGARNALLALDPDAQRTNWQAEAGSTGDDPSTAERTEAVLRKINETVTRQMKTNMWLDIGRDIVVSSVVLAVAAPAAAAVLSGVAKTAYSVANTLATMGRVGKTLATVARVAGSIAEHTALRLQSLSPAAERMRATTQMGRVLEGVLVRGINAGVRNGIFALGMSGGVSGGINWAMHEFKADSPYRSGGQAFVEGYKAGASWGARNVWVNYVGLPSNAFEETSLASTARSLADRGLVGNTAAFGQWTLGKFGVQTGENLVDRGMGWMMGRGWAGAAAGTTLSMADQFAKYYAFNQLVGGVASEASWRFNSVDGNDVERRIKRAQQAGLAAMDMPYWALIPTFSAKTAAQVEQMQRGQQGFAEYKKSGELDRIANAAADIAELPLKEAPSRPMVSRLFDFNIMDFMGGAEGEKGTFKVTKEMKYEAIRLELENAVTGGQGGKPNPFEYFRISQQENGMAGRLHVTDEVRDQAQGMFEKSILQNPALAEQILRAEPGSKVNGNRVRLGHQEEVARILYTNGAKDGVTKAQVQLAEGVLKPYIETEQNVGARAKDLLEAIAKTKEPSPAYQKFIEGMLQKTSAWKNDPVAVKKTGYMDLVAQFRQDAKAAGLSASEHGVVETMMDYFQAIESRLNHFNSVGSASSRAERALGALRLEAQTGGAAAKDIVVGTIDGMLKKVAQWRDAQPSLEAAVGKSYAQMVEEISNSLKDLGGKLSRSDMGLLRQAVKEVQSSPALLRNPKGDGLMGWRPEQFEGLMHFMYSVTLDGANSSEVIRTFLRMKTGGGKTMLAFEGLLPIAEADGALHGGKLKSVFLTVQSNLESQARLDYRAMKKVLTNLQIDTWEGFKTKIAQNKLDAKGGADEYWILGDEMDGAALQPALTIGETTAGISRDNTGYRLLKDISKRMKEVLDRGPAEIQKAVETEARRQQALVDTMEPGEVQDKLRASSEELIGLADRMTQLQGRGDTAGMDRLAKRMDKVLKVQRELLAASDDPAARGVLEAGQKISQTVQDRATLGQSDLKLAKTLFGDMLREQQSVLNQTAPQGREQARALRRLAAAQRSEGNVAEAAKLEAQAQKIVSESAEARTALEDNSAAMRRLLTEGKPGWELEARKLIGERTSLVERSVVKENPIYETFRRMRAEMYGLVNSKLRVTQTADLLAETPGRAADTLTRAADQLTADASSLAKRLREQAAGSPNSQALLKQADDILAQANSQASALRQSAAELKTRLESPLNAEHAAAYEARDQAGARLARAEQDLAQVRADLRSASADAAPALGEKLKTAEAEATRWRGDYQKANARVQSFEAPRLEAAKQALAELRTQSAAASEAWNTRLASLRNPEADALRRTMTGVQTSFDTQAKRLEWTPERAVDVLQRRITGVPTYEYLGRTALHYTGAQWLMSKIPGVSEWRWSRPMTQTDVGLVRTYARELMGEFMRDPFLPPQVRWKMLWSLAPSTILPRGVTGRGSGWVLTEFLNLATGYTDNAANIRMDNITGKVNVIHNGQWFDSMDTPTRRYWELEYNTDLTLPYDHKTQVTMNDFVRDNRNVRFVGFSGTAGEKFRDYLGKYDVKIVGVGSEGVKDIGLSLQEGPAGKFKAIGDAVRQALAHDQAQVAAGRQADSLVVLSLPDTRMVKEVRRYLMKTGALTPEQMAMVFSDSELLRLNRPEAQVERQMNLDGLNNGKVKLLILDTRVGGRGLDLNFKGQRGGQGFGGYFDFNMLVVDPQLASEAHFLQAQGRIDLGRIYSSADPSRGYHPDPAVRRFSMVMDLETAAKDPVFMRMVREEPVFQQLRRNARVMELAYQNGRFSPTWPDIHAFIQEARAGGRGGFVVQRYEDTVRRYLQQKQLQVEQDQLRSAGVLNEAGSFDPHMYGLSPVVPGTPYPGLP